MSKAKPHVPSGTSGNAAPQEASTFRSNPEVDARIDAHIKENPKYWSYVRSMPRERLERSVVLNEVRQLERQQRMREGILKQIGRSPALKAAYDLLVKDLPEDQRETVIAQLARQTSRAAARLRSQTQTEQNSVKV